MASAQDYINESKRDKKPLKISARQAIQISSQKNVRFVKKFKNRPTVNAIGGFFSGLNQGAARLGQSVVKSRRRNIIYNRDLNRPLVGSGIKKQGRGRPVGTVKYRDDQGRPIGVYEYRILLRARLRAQAQTLKQRGRLTPAQQYALQELQRRQQAQQQNPENQVIADTYGNVPAGTTSKSFTQEITDAANIIP